MGNTGASMDLLFGRTRQRVLAVLLLEPDRAFHLRELARLSGSHPGTVMRELDKLTEAGLLVRSSQGNQVLYRADRGSVLFADLSAMFRKTHGAVEVIREALQPVAARVRLALLFGSVARGEASQGSDVDVLIVGDASFASVVRALHPAQQALHREVNPVVWSAEELRARRSESFVRELVTRPVVFVRGGAHDLAELVADPAPAGAPSGRGRGAKVAGLGAAQSRGRAR